MPELELGAIWLGAGQVRFTVWAPKVRTVEVHLLGDRCRYIALEPREHGYFSVVVDDVNHGDRYTYRLDGDDEWPDPASRWQPEGVHASSAVVDPTFDWTDDGWRGIPQEDLIIYELHVGTFSPEGTFDGVIPFLPYLRDLGVTAVELLPVAQFPGERNWGYDGVDLFAPHSAYGGPEGLRRLVDACHAHGLAVLLDVVYNHLGPEGNYTGKYGNYFTSRYHTPWGDAVNVDGPGSDEVRRFFIENALYWTREYHVDGFRLDATDRIIDESAIHFLRQLSTAVRDESARQGRQIWTIAESDVNDVRYVVPAERNGHGLDAQWADDFHHALHALLTGERVGYYEQFGSAAQLAKAIRQAFVFDGIYSEYRQRTYGNSPDQASARQFVVCSQNHDQVGNRATGERLSTLVDRNSARLAAVVYLFSPYLPLIFMGEEYAETAPFQFFTSHTDHDLAEAVSKGRREEFSRFDWHPDVPDPQDPATFQRSKLDHSLRESGEHREMLKLYRALIRLRRERPALARLDKERQEVTELDGDVLLVRRWAEGDEVAMVYNLAQQPRSPLLPLPPGVWQVILATVGDRSSERLSAPDATRIDLPARSAVVLARTGSA